MAIDVEEIAARARTTSKSYLDTKSILRDFLSELEFEQKQRGGRQVLTLSISEMPGAVFVGDVHGDLRTLCELLRRANLSELIDRGYRIVFLGDYIDRGPEQLEALLFVALLKQRLGSKVLTLRGNHEPLSWLPVYPHDFPYVLRARFGEEQSRELYALCREVFEHLILLLYVPSKLIAVHGGPPITRVLSLERPEDILSVESDNEALEDILWSDPVDDLETPWMYSYRGAGKLWGPQVTQATLRKLGIELIIRAHEPCPIGYKLNHGGRVLTLFSMKGYYGNIAAAAMVTDIETVGKDIEKKMVLA